MRYLWSILWHLCEGLTIVLAFPIDRLLGNDDDSFSYWELKWPRYAIGTLGFVVVALTLTGCLCCRRQRRPKGFQEFKDGSGVVAGATAELPSSLELEVPRLPMSSSQKIYLEPLPVIGEALSSQKPKPPSPSLLPNAMQSSSSGNFQPSPSWFSSKNSHVPRDRLKYLREIGRGWFGKVVEGTATDSAAKNRGVVVKILTEEATSKEKAWFLGEATPYLKLSHPNVLGLLGTCLEADPYLLLFESCPAGDLKGFLRANRDKGTCEALRKENVPVRMALDISRALEHMHDCGFAHTDLSARNCLVAPDLTAKLGDYGTGVEKYPADYYILGDRALPIRWSAPESLECTETTIETRAITPRANLWSFSVLLWEIASWGERPFDDLGDEQVIEMIFSLKNGFFEGKSKDALAQRFREDFAAESGGFLEAVQATWKFVPEERASLNKCREILGEKRIENFEERWENLRPNGGEREKSVSLQDLRGNEAEEQSNSQEKQLAKAQFRLGPEEPVKNPPKGASPGQEESGEETEEESWRGRVERGAYTEKVKQKSKSVADLMVLVHIDSDSEAEVSLGPQISAEKPQKKRLPASGSDGDLRSHVFTGEFDEAIRKLREPSNCNGAIIKSSKNPWESSHIDSDTIEKPKLLTLTHQDERPILRLCFGGLESVETSKDTRENVLSGPSIVGKIEKSSSEAISSTSVGKNLVETAKSEGPVLRLVSKGDPQLPVLRYLPGRPSQPEKVGESSHLDSFLSSNRVDSESANFSSNFEAFPSGKRLKHVEDDVELWNNALARELEKKNPGFEAHTTIFDDCALENASKSPRRSASAPETPKSQMSAITGSAEQDFPVSLPETPQKNDFVSKIDKKIDRNADNLKDLPAFLSSVPKSPGKYFSEPQVSAETSQKTDFNRFSPGIDVESSSSFPNLPAVSSSAPETPKKHFSQPEVAAKMLKNADFHRFSPEIDANTSNSYPNSPAISSSAPETPGKYYSQPEVSKNSPVYRQSSASAPETPEFRRNVQTTNVLEEDSSTCEDLEASEKILRESTPDTPLSRGNYSVGNIDEDSSTGEEFGVMKRSLHEIDDDEDRNKLLSTPDDERSSDSGFRDKESCEEEESPIPKLNSIQNSISVIAANSSPLSTEEEQMRILYELDTILDAEYYGNFGDDDKLEEIRENDGIFGKNRSVSESLESTESTEIVDTVRANSCEPHFLDSRDNNDEEVKKLADFLRREGEEENLTAEIGDDTENDFAPDSTSESTRTDKNFTGLVAVESASDSSAEIRKLDLRSFSDGKFDDSYDLSVELRSSEISEVLRSKVDDSTSEKSKQSETKDDLLEDFDYSPENSREKSGESSKLFEQSTDLDFREDGKTEDFSEESLRISGKSSDEDFKAEVSGEIEIPILKSNENSKHCEKSSEFVEKSKLGTDNSKSDEETSGFLQNLELETGEPRNYGISAEFSKKSELETEKSIHEKSTESSEKSESKPEKSKISDESPKLAQKSESSTENSAIHETSSGSSFRSEINIETLKNDEKSIETSQKSATELEISKNLEHPTDFKSPITDFPIEISKPFQSTHTTENFEKIVKNDCETSSKTPEKLSPEAENSSKNSPPSSERSSSKTSSLPQKSGGKSKNPENSEISSDSPGKTDRNNSDVSMETRGPSSVNSDQWSSRENIDNENDDEEEDEESSTMSLRSDNSYVSFGLDEEFVAAIRNELREKLPRAQMPVVEALDPRDDKEASINAPEMDSKGWEEEESERGSGGVDISIRYNIYGTPLSPILEERESGATSESLASREDDASIDVSRASEDALSEDVLVVDTRTNRAIIVNSVERLNLQDDDRDTSHGELSDDENLDYQHNRLRMESKRISMGSGGAPLPSPEEETKWQQQFPVPLQMQDDLMSTSFGTDRDWDSQDEDEGEDDGGEGEEDEEENSSSSGEFVWKRYDESHGDLENVATRSPPNKLKSHEPEADLEEEEEEEEEEEDEEGDDEDDEDEEEFTPSAWDATLAPHRSALRSPEKTPKSDDQKKSVWFKKQRYHCVYEYPKETPIVEGQGQAATTWEPTSYADWEEMMDEPRLDVYPMEYDESNRRGDEEFYVSSSNRPFQFQSGEGKYVSQFFPGASATLLQSQPQPPLTLSEEKHLESQDEVDRVDVASSTSSSSRPQPNGSTRSTESLENQQQPQLGELRHTRDRLKLNLLSTSGSSKLDEDTVDNLPAGKHENQQLVASETEKTIVPDKKSVETGKIIFSDEKSIETGKPIFPDEKSIETEKTIFPDKNLIETEPTIFSDEKSIETEKTIFPDEKSLETEKTISPAEKSIETEKAGKIATEKLESNGTIEKKSSSENLTVIDDFLSAGHDLPLTGDQKNPSGDSNVEKIVDIPKLESEESARNARDEEKRENVEKSTEIEDEGVLEISAVSIASISSLDNVEKTTNFAREPES